MAEMLTVRDIMTKTPVTLKPEMTIEQAIDVLLKNKISGATVVDDQKQVVGVLSEKDCLRVFANGAFNMLPGAHVSEYMSREVMTISPDADLFTVAGLFIAQPFRRLPVIENGHLIGQVSRRDVLAGSRKIWESSTIKKEWTDSKYLTDEIKAKLESRRS